MKRERVTGRVSAWGVRLLWAAVAAGGPGSLSAQVGFGDFVVTGGLSWEGYRGNFSAVTLPVIDSTDHAAAAVGEFGARGRLRFLEEGDRALDVSFDGGLRQFAAVGFELRDYAPREWVSRVGATYGQGVGDLGRMTLAAGYRNRSVDDRPPMPLFLQPGYGSITGSGYFQLRPIQRVTFDAEVDLERTDYGAPLLLPQLDLLDRDSQGFELGAGASGGGDWSVRFFTGFRWSQYERQSTSDAEDPYRRDRTVSIGARWSLQGAVLATLGVEGTVNRSNSKRPEYDAVSVRGEVSAVLPWWDVSTNVFALLTSKSYIHQTEFARLVPGEEADNASVVYLDLVCRTVVAFEDGLRFGLILAKFCLARPLCQAT